ncbi:cupin domain-containing protein [Paenibacillus glycanilyticus]|uniref:cupin domain-containing protein n=1 Tax=Paenibacillus glycanilyticus TaxID=126569 RepID=UPI002041A5CA|nr:cupin domain-containing protein [Paenibacillus glycanilyticus]MCM3626716.1 cupin domain-containing protein [Paenibacillus glycanilyticus]
MNNQQQTEKDRVAIFHRSSDIEWLYQTHIPGERTTIRVSGEDTNGAYAIVDAIIYATDGDVNGPPIHIHQRTDEIFRILEGTAHIYLEGEEFDAVAGDVVVIPKGKAHTFANFSDTPLHMQATFIPAGEEQSFKEVIGKTPEEIIELSKTKYHVIISGPPLQKK